MTYYIYALCYTDGTPFYVGMTSRLYSRIAGHLRTYQEDSPKGRILQSLASQGILPLVTILTIVQGTKADALAMERKFIQKLPNLSNKQDNGKYKSVRVFTRFCKECDRTWDSTTRAHECAVGRGLHEVTLIDSRMVDPNREEFTEFGRRARERVRSPRVRPPTLAMLKEMQNEISM